MSKAVVAHQLESHEFSPPPRFKTFDQMWFYLADHLSCAMNEVTKDIEHLYRNILILSIQEGRKEPRLATRIPEKLSERVDGLWWVIRAV